MALTSDQISQAMASQTSMFSGQMAMSQQLAYQGRSALYPGMAPPAPVNYGAMAQNAMLPGAHFMGNTVMPMAGAGLSLAGGLGMLGPMGRVFDPFGAMMMGGRMGFGAMGGGAMGLAGGALGAAAGFLPFYAAGTLGSAYTNAALQGMHSQRALNTMLTQNFNFAGGAGHMGRGFGMGQMGMIGNVINTAARSDPFTSMSELTGLVGMGAQSGMFTAVRDVREFTEKFRQMLSTLKTVQDELGGSLQEALAFVNQAKQSGIYKAADRAAFSGLVRQTGDITGLSQDRILQMTNYGSRLTRALGGTGAQGAVGATLALQQIGAAVQSGVIDEELLSEATGGLTGDAAMMAFGQNMMARAGRLTRRGFGRYSIFGLANEDGTGIDADKMARFLAGDMSMGEIGRSAYQTVGRIGRARAMRNEGLLRASAIQQGGLAFEAGKMRALLGDRILSQDDDIVQAVLQRRFRMNRAEATAMTSMIRNLPEIATSMAFEAEQSDVDRRQANFMAENQSLEGLKRRIGQYVSDGLGVGDAREWGRRLYAKVGSAVEEFTNDLFGITRQQLSQEGRDRVRRVIMGRGSAADFEALANSGGVAFDARAQLRSGLLQGGSSDGQLLQAAGYDVAGMNFTEFTRASAEFTRAQSLGLVSGASEGALRDMMANRSDTVSLLAKAAQQGSFRKSLQYIRDNGRDVTAALAAAKQMNLNFGQSGGLSGVLQPSMSITDRWLSWFQGGTPEAAAQRLEDTVDRDHLRRIGAARGQWWNYTNIQNEDLEEAFKNNLELREAARYFALTPGDTTAGLMKLREAAMGHTVTPKQRASLLTMIDGIEKRRASGLSIEQMATDLATLSFSDPQDKANMIAQAQAVEKLRMRYGDMAAMFPDSLLGEQLKLVEDGDFGGIYGAQQALSRMGTLARSEALSRLGSGPEATGLRQGAMFLSRQRRELRGGGYRGAAGSRDALYAMMGGVAGSLEIEVDGSLVRGNSRRLLTQGLRGLGGKKSEAAVEALRSEYLNMGLTPDEAEQAIALQSDVLKDGKISDPEITQLQDFKTTTAGQKLDKSARERQRRQDPLDSDRNDYLAKIVKSSETSLITLKYIAENQLTGKALENFQMALGEQNMSYPKGE